MSYLGYKAYGLLVASPIEIKGAPHSEYRGGTPDIEVSLEDIPDDWSPQLVDPPYERMGPRLLFSQPGCARYLCEPDRIRIAVQPSADGAEVAAMLVATALPAVLWIRGNFVMHAASAVLPGHHAAIAIAGPSGTGKSTLLAALLSHGARVVADDTCVIAQSSGGEIVVKGLPSVIAEPNTAPATARRCIPVPPDQILSSAPLAALFVLTVSDRPGAETFAPLAGIDAWRTLLLQRHRPRIPRIMKIEADTLPITALISSLLPIFNWRRNYGCPDPRAEEIKFLTAVSAACLRSRPNTTIPQSNI